MRAGWVAWMALASACSSDSGLVGSIAYTEPGTNNVRVRDLASGHDTLIDPGQFGSISIAPDAQHVIYAGADQLPKLAGRSGFIRRLPGSAYVAPATWISNSAALYGVSDGSIVLPSLDGTSRALDNIAVVSPDHTQVANVDAQGNIVLENLDGTNHRILSPSIAPTSRYPMESMIGFTPDQHAVLVADTSTSPVSLHIISIADGSSIDVADASMGGTPFGSPGPRVIGASPFSSDGSEVLMQSTTALIAVSLATGAKRTISTFVPMEASGGAVFLDDQRVLWMRLDDHSTGDAGQIAVTMHVTGPSGDVVIDGPLDNAFTPTIAVLPDDTIAMTSDVVLVKTDGTVLVHNAASPGDVTVGDILGVTPDGKGVMITSYLGVVRYLGLDGEMRDIVTASSGGNGLLAPFAAYTPGR